MRTSAPNINKIQINQYVIRYKFKNKNQEHTYIVGADAGILRSYAETHGYDQMIHLAGRHFGAHIIEIDTEAF